MEYKIVTSGLAQVVEGEVTRLLKDGWQLHGGLAVGSGETDGTDIYAQAMTREVDSGPVDFASTGEKQGHAQLGGY